MEQRRQGLRAVKAETVLAEAHALLLDFDGPVCSVFAGIPAVTVADQLRQILVEDCQTEIPKTVAISADPFDVFRYASTLGAQEARYIEAAFTAHEVEAVASATPADGAHNLIQAWQKSGRPLAIVSNNSTAAIRTYLSLYNLQKSIGYIAARTSADASLLKPNPHLLQEAAAALEVTASECVFIGDSPSDMDAARAARIRAIGFANKAGKRELLVAHNASATIKNWRALPLVTSRE
jgi:HAD superfamily hydrolase (TIGR01509 family)